jgi:hypothetical protein
MASVDIRAMLDQKIGDFEVAGPSGFEQRRAAESVAGVYRCAERDKPSYLRQVPGADGKVQSLRGCAGEFGGGGNCVLSGSDEQQGCQGGAR